MSTSRVEDERTTSLIMMKTQKQQQHDIEKFSPRGLRVLVVDDNPLCLAVIEGMLQQCEYNVTVGTRVSQAISLLTENKEGFDIVMCEVSLPQEDGFKLLEVANLALNLPVILMSSNGETSVVMRGITAGACDYLIKPIRIEQLRNIWQHVVRRHQQQRINLWEDLGESSDGGKTLDSPESSSKKKRKEAHDIGTRQVIEDISGLKKARVHWTVQLHQQFVKAVNQLQIDKAVPKKILEIMKVQGLTRENVASHLQKYRLYLRRLSGIIPEPRPVASFQAAGDGKSGGTMQIRHCVLQQQEEHQSLTTPVALKAFNLSPAGTVIPSNRGGGLIDKATLTSLHQYRAYEQRRAADRAGHADLDNCLQPDSKPVLGVDPDAISSKNTLRYAGSGRMKKNSASSMFEESAEVADRLHCNTSHTNTTAITICKVLKMEGMDRETSLSPSSLHRMSDLSQHPSPSLPDLPRKTTFADRRKGSDKLSSWDDPEDSFVDKFVHEYELPNLTAAVPAQDFISSTSAVPEFSDYLIDDLLTQPK